MRVKIIEALALLGVGLFIGITTTMVDVFAVGSATFVSHVCLWVVLNTLLACHVENRVRALWWSAPFNLGFIEGFFATTAVTYEGFLKSTIAPLSAMAVLSPLLVYGLWTVKNCKDLYGKVISVLVGAGIVGFDYAINHTVSVYGIVCAIVCVAFLGFIPTRKIKITPGVHPVTDAEILEAERAAEAEREAAKRRKPSRRDRKAKRAREDMVEEVVDEREGKRRLGRRASDEGRDRSREAVRGVEDERRRKARTSHQRTAPDQRDEGRETAPQRPTKRTGTGQVRRVRTTSVRPRYDEQEREERMRRERRAASEERRSRRSERDDERAGRYSRPATLGNTRVATRSRRGDIYGYE